MENQTLPLPLSETDPKVTCFVQALEKLCNDHLRERFAILAERYRVVFTLETGPKFIRVVRSEKALKPEDAGNYGSRCVHCFIDRSNGNILKPAGWKGPEKKNPRGNLSDPNPLAGVTVYGCVYLR
jgi:hypothetical protein